MSFSFATREEMEMVAYVCDFEEDCQVNKEQGSVGVFGLLADNQEDSEMSEQEFEALLGLEEDSEELDAFMICKECFEVNQLSDLITDNHEAVCKCGCKEFHSMN